MENEFIVLSKSSLAAICLGSGNSDKKPFRRFPLPSRLTLSEIQDKIGNFEFLTHDRYLYLFFSLAELDKSEKYLVAYFSKAGQKTVSYIFWDDSIPVCAHWHFSTDEELRLQINCKRNAGIIYIYD